MPYKIHKTAGGKFKLYRQATDGKPARPMSSHPQTKETATAQLRAIEANTKPETHSAMCMYAITKSPNGKYQVSRNRKLETMSGPPNEKRNKDGKWEAKKPHGHMETMAGPPDEARDDTGKWTAGGNQSGQGSTVKSPSSGISTTKKQEIKMGREASERGMARTDTPVPKFKEPSGLKGNLSDPNPGIHKQVPYHKAVGPSMSPQQQAEADKRAYGIDKNTWSRPMVGSPKASQSKPSIGPSGRTFNIDGPRTLNEISDMVKKANESSRKYEYKPFQ